MRRSGPVELGDYLFSGTNIAEPHVDVDQIALVREARWRGSASCLWSLAISGASLSAPTERHPLRAANNLEALAILESQAPLARVVRGRMGFSPARIDAMRREHRALIEALDRRDAERAARLLRLHTRGSLRDMLNRVPA